MKHPQSTFAGKDGERFYLLAGQFAMARATKLGDEHWKLTGHIAGDPVPNGGYEFRGKEANVECFQAAKRLAYHREFPGERGRSGKTLRGLQAVVVWRKAV
jgi:hypothetical protein